MVVMGSGTLQQLFEFVIVSPNKLNRQLVQPANPTWFKKPRLRAKTILTV
jgi:hypothetical protein